MLYKDKINEQQFLKLSALRGVCVSLFLPTSRVTQDTQADRIKLKNLAKAALEQAEIIADKRQVRAMEEAIDDLHDDDDFWNYQGNGLGVFVTPGSLKTYRLSYQVDQAAEVSDRFYMKPLVPALRPKSAYVLGISQKTVTMYEFTPAQELEEVDVPGMPKDFSDATGRTLQRDRAASGRLQGDEGKRILQTQFLRAVEKSVSPFVAGSNMPLILATTAHLYHTYQSLNSYDLLVEAFIEGSVENLPQEDLRTATIPLVGELRQARIDRWMELYRQRKAESRALADGDFSTIAKLASQGQVSHLLVDADQVQYGTISDNNEVRLVDVRSAESYDILDEIVVRVLQMGGEVLAIRKEENAPAELMPIAAILRWS